MDKILLQTLKNVEKVPSEIQLDNLSIEVTSVLRNFKPTVRSRREYEPDDDLDFDTVFEKELQKVEQDVDNIYMIESLPKIEAELALWTKEYQNLRSEYEKLHEDNVKDQNVLKQSDDRIKEKLSRIAIVESIKKSLLKEVRMLCLILKKTKAESDEKLKRSSNNFKDIIRYLNRGFETERLGYYNTVEILRKLEHKLRDTFYKYENSQANENVLQMELKKLKNTLHTTQNELKDQKKASHKSAIYIQQLEIDLEDALERADYAQKALKKNRVHRI